MEWVLCGSLFLSTRASRLTRQGWPSLRTKRRTPTLFRLLGGVEEGAEFVDVLGEHAGESDAGADLRVGGGDRGEHEESAINLQLELETRTDGEWEDRFNVASAEAEVRRGAADGRVPSLKNSTGTLTLKRGCWRRSGSMGLAKAENIRVRVLEECLRSQNVPPSTILGSE
jgi:hypothetical protein